MSISERKLAGTNQIISEEPIVDKLPEESPTGHRFMDMDTLSNVFDAVARCPDCGNKLKLLQTKKQGISFEMMLSCLNTECQWTYCFWTSKKKKKSEVLLLTEGYIIQCEELEMVVKDWNVFWY